MMRPPAAIEMACVFLGDNDHDRVGLSADRKAPRGGRIPVTVRATVGVLLERKKARRGEDLPAAHDHRAVMQR